MTILPGSGKWYTESADHKSSTEKGGQKHSVVSVLHEFNGRKYLKFMPHGYSNPISLPVITKGSRDDANAWTWNGSTESPDLKPSIRTRHSDGTVSHLWLNNGVCEHLNDSTDGLAGQTLPLRDFEH